jgi:hypothetical protein
MAKAPPKSLRITHGLRIWTVISIYAEMTHTHGRTRDPVYDLHVPWDRGEGEEESVYNGGGCAGRESGSGGKKSVP